MNPTVKFTAVALCAAALAACSGKSSSIPAMQQINTPQSYGQSGNVAGLDLSRVHVMQPFYHHVVHPGSGSNLVYHGGPTEHKVKIYLIFWGFQHSGADPSAEAPYTRKFIRGLGGSSWLDTTDQYYETSRGNIINPGFIMGGVWFDNSTVPSAPNNGQIIAEAVAGEQHFGYNADANYVVNTPHNHNTPGFGSNFCAYHGFSSSPGGIIAFTNEPYMTDAGQNCGENIVNPGPGGKLDGQSIVLGHELAEAQTDPRPFSGWWGPNSEIGDACAWVGLGNITLKTGTFAMQPLWSNASSSCVLAGP